MAIGLRVKFESGTEDQGPAIQELGDRAPQSPPDIKEFPVHNIIKG